MNDIGKYLIGLSLLALILSGQVVAQADVFSGKLLEDATGEKLETAIKYSSQKQAIYSYNIANATTQGFRPILLPEDRAELQRLFDVAPDDQAYLSKVMIEHFMAKVAENNKRQQALYVLYKKRVENLRKVVTLGKQ
eukprot:COSAG01_NODE_519_length_16012_cov_4.344058_15_plen_137_part_00